MTVNLGHRAVLVVYLELDVAVESASVDMIYVAAEPNAIRVFLIQSDWEIIKHEDLLQFVVNQALTIMEELRGVLASIKLPHIKGLVLLLFCSASES